jgi:agmatine deiminase
MDARESGTPRQLGFAMPAEWERHEATWLAWPRHRLDWPGKFHPIAWVYCDIVRRLAGREKVRILVADEKTGGRVRNLLRRCGADPEHVEFFPYQTDRSWTRDFCPIFVRSGRGEVAITDWRFNGWAKYPNWQRDDGAPAFIGGRLGLQAWQPEWNGQRIVLEGGSIDVNGQGALLTTEECLLSPVQARNPGLGRTEMEEAMGEYLGIRKVLWLRNGIVGDDTHGHVDDLARFTGPRTVVLASEADPEDANYRLLQENRELLEGMTDQDGGKLEIVPLPMPEPVVFRGQRLPASYANFYIANGLVLAPTFNDPNDRIALGILADLFPGRKVIGIHCADLVWGLGTIHCMTQQQPAPSN